MCEEYYRWPDLVLRGGGIPKITQIHRETMIRANGHAQIKCPPQGRSLPSNTSLAAEKDHFQASGDHRLKDRVPGNKPGRSQVIVTQVSAFGK